MKGKTWMCWRLRLLVNTGPQYCQNSLNVGTIFLLFFIFGGYMFLRGFCHKHPWSREKFGLNWSDFVFCFCDNEIIVFQFFLLDRLSFLTSLGLRTGVFRVDCSNCTQYLKSTCSCSLTFQFMVLISLQIKIKTNKCLTKYSELTVSHSFHSTLNFDRNTMYF